MIEADADGSAFATSSGTRLDPASIPVWDWSVFTVVPYALQNLQFVAAHPIWHRTRGAWNSRSHPRTLISYCSRLAHRLQPHSRVSFLSLSACCRVFRVLYGLVMLSEGIRRTLPGGKIMWNAMPSRVLTKPTREMVASLDQMFASLVMLSFRGHVYDQLSGQRRCVSPSYCFHWIF